MDLIQDAFRRLFPEKEFPYQTSLEYNRRLAAFNANIRLYQNTLFVHLNLRWKEVDREIKIGLIQNLLLKILKEKIDTPQITLYTNFVKNIPLFAEKNKTDPLLEASFHRVNEQFFSKAMEQPNLQWGTESRRKLAHYNFHDDSVTVSTLFKEAKTEVLDYLMYHELLHKYHQFIHKNGRGSYHSREFRRDEERYPQQQMMEEEIKKMVRKRKSILGRKGFLQGLWE